MAKTDILDYSTTASENQDIGGISILGTAKPSNLDDGMRMEMAHIAKGLVTRRVAKDTAYTAVKADHNQMIDFTETATLTTSSAATLTSGWMCFVYASGGSVTINPNGSETVNGEESVQISEGTLGILRVYDGNFLFSPFGGGSGLPLITVYDTSGSFTHTFDSGTTKFQVEGSGAGGAGQSVLATASQGGVVSCGGGHSGWFGQSDVLDRDEIESASITIGAGGTSYTNSGGTATDGGNTIYDDGVNDFTWGGGFSPPSLLRLTGTFFQRYGQASTLSAGLTGAYNRGDFGHTGDGVTTNSGQGGSTPYGSGGEPVSGTSAGQQGAGNGSGGGGAHSATASSTGYLGGVGRPGIVIIKEWS